MDPFHHHLCKEVEGGESWFLCWGAVARDGWRKWEEETKHKHASSLPGDRAEKLENVAGPWLVQLSWLLAAGRIQQHLSHCSAGNSRAPFSNTWIWIW